MKPEPDFDLHDLVAELTKAAEEDDSGVTVQELMDALNWSDKRVHRRLLALKHAGRLELVPRRIETLNGREMMTMAYRLKGAG